MVKCIFMSLWFCFFPNVSFTSSPFFIHLPSCPFNSHLFSSESAVHPKATCISTGKSGWAQGSTLPFASDCSSIHLVCVCPHHIWLACVSLPAARSPTRNRASARALIRRHMHAHPGSDCKPDGALNYSLPNNAVRELLCALLVCLLSSLLLLLCLPSSYLCTFFSHFMWTLLPVAFPYLISFSGLCTSLFLWSSVQLYLLCFSVVCIIPSLFHLLTSVVIFTDDSAMGFPLSLHQSHLSF